MRTATWLASYRCVVFLAALLSGACGGITADVPTYKVVRGEFVNRVTVTGELAAVRSRMITAPNVSYRLGALKIVRLTTDGEKVAEGDLLAEFDRTEVEKNKADAQTELEIAEAELRKAVATHKSEEAASEIDLEIAGINQQIAVLTLEQAAFDADVDRKGKELKLEEAALAQEKARQDLENKRSVNRQDVVKLELKVEQVQAKLEEAQDTIDKMTILAPTPGIAIIARNWSTSAKYQVGDQPYGGWSLIEFPDLSRIQAKVEVNEVDIARVHLDDAAEIRLDAYPDSMFTGKVTDIAVLARKKNRNSNVKVFDVAAELDRGGEKLLPGMTISCDVIVERQVDTLFVPLDAVFTVKGEPTVYVKDGGGFKARTVSLGGESDDHVLVVSGVKEGDQVALSDPTLAADTRRAEEES